jgi:hypothetical protein
MTSTGCPDDNRLVEYVEGLLPPPEQATIDHHVDSCAACRRVLAQFALGSRAPAAPEVAHELASLDRRYEILELLGSGAMSFVYAAQDHVLDRRVALKVLRDLDPRRNDTIATEARAMARLAHPNVVSVYDVGIAGGRMYMTAELVAGTTIAGWLASGARPWRDVVGVFAQAARGLAAAHAAGITHRDFKPSNMLLGGDGRVRISDFGLARRTTVGAEDLATTHAGELVGTPAYMAPEQLAGEPADARSDHFAFCVALFESLHGERPFRGASLHALYEAIERGERVRPSQRVPARLTRLVERGLAFAPARRVTSMEDIARELDSIAVKHPLRTLGITAAAVAAVGLLAAVVVLGWPHASGDLPEASAVASRRDAGGRTSPPPPPPPSPPQSVPARDAGARASVAVSSPRDAGITTVRNPRGDAAVTASLHPIPPEHRAAVIAALRALGYKGLTFDGDPEANLADVRAKLAAVPADDRSDAVMWQVAIGHIERKRGDCAAATRAYEAASAEAQALYAKLGQRSQVGRAHSQTYLEWEGRAWFGIALCKVELDAPDAVPYLAHPWMRWIDPDEIDLARGIVAYETGDRETAKVQLSDLLFAQHQQVHGVLATWAKAIGLPIEWP